jgi:replicative DNA helicase
MEVPKKQTGITKQTQHINLPQAKVPPQAVELEKAIIGAMMIDKRGVDEVIDIITEKEIFYLPEHQEIYDAIFSLFKEGKPIDIYTVTEALRSRGTLQEVGGEYYLITLSNIVATAAHIEYHARIVLQMYVKRRLIEISGEITEKAYDETVDVLDLLDNAEQELFKVSQGSLKRGNDNIANVIADVKEHLEQLAKQEGLSGISTGFPSLDDYTSGWQNGDLIIIAARPGMGKTAFVLSMARNMAVDHNVPVAIFNLEMTADQLGKRLLSIETEIPADKFRSGKLTEREWQVLNNNIAKISEAKIYINDSSMLSIFDLRAQARRLKSQFDIGILIIDYLQLMTAQSNHKSGNREQEISTISRNLKALAKELNIPVIALSQLSRKVEERSDKGGHKRPQLSDLRESGAIEQDADIVSFIYRPEYYKIIQWEDDTPTDNQAEFIIAKHRNGKTGNIRMRFDGQFGRFSELQLQDDEFTMESKMNAVPPNTDFGIDSFDPYTPGTQGEDDLAF